MASTSLEHGCTITINQILKNKYLNSNIKSKTVLNIYFFKFDLLYNRSPDSYWPSIFYYICMLTINKIILF